MPHSTETTYRIDSKLSYEYCNRKIRYWPILACAATVRRSVCLSVCNRSWKLFWVDPSSAAVCCSYCLPMLAAKSPPVAERRHSACASTPWAIKTFHFILERNFHVSWRMFTLLVPTETTRMQRSYKIYDFVTVSPHHFIKLTAHKTALFEVDRHTILLLNSKNNESMS